jgi:GAF domain-containing protein
LIVAPLRARGAAIGVIGAATTEPHEYRAADLKVLAAIAALTGPAIDQAQTREAGAEVRAS